MAVDRAEPAVDRAEIAVDRVVGAHKSLSEGRM
jgi:hypothetical protein